MKNDRICFGSRVSEVQILSPRPFLGAGCRPVRNDGIAPTSDFRQKDNAPTLYKVSSYKPRPLIPNTRFTHLPSARLQAMGNLKRVIDNKQRDK